MLEAYKDDKKFLRLIKDLDEDDKSYLDVNFLTFEIDICLEIEIMEAWIVKENDVDVGFYLFLDQQNGYARTPPFVFKEFRGQGYGKQIVALAEDTVKSKGLSKVLYGISHFNTGMLELSRSCGYETCSKDSEYIYLSKELEV
jgi:GNAT superfamily N-acetyltransferase